eukprot:EG_transcript_34384
MFAPQWRNLQLPDSPLIGRLHPHSYGKGLNFAEAGPSAILASPIAAGGPTAFPDRPLALRSPASPASPLAVPGPYSPAAPLDYPVHPLSARSFPLPPMLSSASLG